MNNDKIIVLGVGNTLLKDEGIGVKVIEVLEREYDFPDAVQLVDGGTQGLWLMSTIQQARHLIVIDAVLGGGPAGSIYRLERNDLPKGLRAKQSSHDSDLIEALNSCSLIGIEPETVVVIGIEPQDISSYGMELTSTIASRVQELIGRVFLELKRLGIEPHKKN